MHKTILADCKVKEETVAARSLILVNWRRIATLAVAYPAANQVDIENLMEANRELTETVRTLQTDAFDYFKKLLSPALAVEWQLTVKDEIGGVDYISLTGTKPGIIMTMDFGSLSPYYFCVLKLVVPIDAAERLRRYMTTNMVLNTDKGIDINMGVRRVIETNNTLPYLPWLKHTEGAHTVIFAMHIKYTEIKLCTIVLNTVNLIVLTVYYPAIQHKFPTDITRLVDQSLQQ